MKDKYFKQIKSIAMVKDGQSYKIKVLKTQSKSNYNLFIAIYEEGGKNPIVGTTMKETATTADFKQYAEKAISRYLTPDNSFLIA